jgi:Cu/Ag efflux protein CusF
MSKLVIALFVAISLVGARATLADEQKPAAGGFSESKEVQATVTAIDLKTRMVTLKDSDGNETTIHVDKRARNLPQVKVGDVVKVAYLQAVAWKVNKSGKAAATKAEAAAVRAEPGEKPGGAAGQRITFTATIEAIDLANGTVTLKGPEGDSHTIKARNPANLKKVKVGDLVDITYTEAVAIKVEPASN